MPGFYLNPLEVDSMNNYVSNYNKQHTEIVYSAQLDITRSAVTITKINMEVFSDGGCSFNSDISITHIRELSDGFILPAWKVIPVRYQDITIKHLNFNLGTL